MVLEQDSKSINELLTCASYTDVISRRTSVSISYKQQ